MTKQSKLGSFFQTNSKNAKSKQSPNEKELNGDEASPKIVDYLQLQSGTKGEILDSNLSSSTNTINVKDQNQNISDTKKNPMIIVPTNQTLNENQHKRKSARIVESDNSESEVEDEMKTKKIKYTQKESCVTQTKSPEIKQISISAKVQGIKDAKSEEKDSNGIYYSEICRMFEQVEQTTKRLEITDITAKYFFKMMSLGSDHLTKCVYLCVNQVAPEYKGIELGVGESLLLKAIASATGKNMTAVKEEVEKCGDLGLVAKNFRTNQRTLFPMPKLTINKVFDTFYEISTSTGASSQQKKVQKITSLLVSGSDIEAKFIIRSLEGKLRIGFAEKTVLTALAQASAFYHNAESKSNPDPEKMNKYSEILKHVYTQLPNYNILVEALFTHGVEKLPLVCKLVPGIPVKPMLAFPTKSVSEVLNRFKEIEFTCEYKYDGERIQIHKCEDGKVVSFSRNSENSTEKFYDILEKFEKFTNEGVSTFVIDAEVVAWDTQSQNILPFQVLSTRKRKDTKESEITVQVCLFVFDILYLNGESMLQKSLNDRRKILWESFKVSPGEFQFAEYKNLKEVDDIQIFLDQSIADNCEGLMVKVLNGEESSYEPSKRSRNWLKVLILVACIYLFIVKKDYLDGVGDSLDLVVIGGYTGKGKRTGVYGGFLLAVYDPDQEEYQAICKIGTGFSEANLKEFKEMFEKTKIEIPKSYYSFGEAEKPDVWFEPTQVSVERYI
ncbi:hypothetical protein BB560_001819 [Smittium megazygosporum]|uniref:DNA ligase n=1 Tax=Smittium megazygosporum TaxID=133381 RepID=A0A2T9ZGH9_9FUNG|nr:hypothetical protein BB560_001819 [Smittium megazygosporum]